MSNKYLCFFVLMFYLRWDWTASSAKLDHANQTGPIGLVRSLILQPHIFQGRYDRPTAPFAQQTCDKKNNHALCKSVKQIAPSWDKNTFLFL